MPDNQIQQAKPKLDALTALRFFAAAMIVFHHSADVFNLEGHTAVQRLALQEGVSFFYVLSGFILTYNYWGLQDFAAVKRFLWARIGRLWPSHIATCGLAICLAEQGFTHISWAVCGIIITNLLMVHAWIPFMEFYYSINPPSWSISDEFFFYICFVALIRPWRSGWFGKLFLGFTLVALCVGIAESIHDSSFQLPQGLGTQYLPYVSPLARLFEFTLGMSVAAAWRRQAKIATPQTVVATLVEVFLILLTVIYVVAIPSFLEAVMADAEHNALAIWLKKCGGAPIFALLIYVVAFQKGAISRLLTHKALVWLGEISYSIYLVHNILLLYAAHRVLEQDLLQANLSLAFALYLTLVMLTAHLNFEFVESPFRKVFRKIADGPGKEPAFSLARLRQVFLILKAHLSSWTKLKRGVIIAECLLLFVLFNASFSYIRSAQSRFHWQQISGIEGATFSDKVCLEKAYLGSANDGIKLKLNWRSLTNQNLDYVVELDAVDANGRSLYFWAYSMDAYYGFAFSGNTWKDSTYLSAKSIKNATSLRLRLSYAKSRGMILPAKQGNNVRSCLIVPIPHGAL
jgi:peptidoglycan/LPS O-acetylase OafA/YrhL